MNPLVLASFCLSGLALLITLGQFLVRRHWAKVGLTVECPVCRVPPGVKCEGGPHYERTHSAKENAR